MRQGIYGNHAVDAQGRPAGGASSTIGTCINWRSVPLGYGDDRKPVNGAFVEDIIDIVIDRIQFYETAGGGRFSRPENKEAIDYLQKANAALDRRTERRGAAGTGGRTRATETRGGRTGRPAPRPIISASQQRWDWP